jgi:hypothetical protein
MFIQGEVSVTEREVKALPEEAIVRLGNQEYIFVKNKNNKIAMVPIGTGLSKEGNIEVKTGLEKVSDGSIVLNHGYKLLGILKNSEEE